MYIEGPRLSVWRCDCVEKYKQVEEMAGNGWKYVDNQRGDIMSTICVSKLYVKSMH